MTVPRIDPAQTVYPNAEPGVYEAGRRVGGRSVYFALGPGGVLVGTRRAREGESDAQVISALRSLYLAATREPLRLISPSGVVGRSASPRRSRRRRLGRVRPRTA